MSGLICGAYAASPAHGTWNAAAEIEFFSGLDQIAQLRGLELPWTGSIHPHDDAWLTANLPSRFEVVLTSIPGTMGKLGQDAAFGLASADNDGRAAALAEALRMREAVLRLNDTLGRRAVLAVELHSAPRETGAVDALASSLDVLGDSADWDGALLTIEHSDAHVPGQAPEKGFLTLTQEIEALALARGDLGIALNWGRSAIELRGDDVVTHVREAEAAGVLRGLMFSGAAAVETAFGYPWIDAHHPMAPAPGFEQGLPESLLTADLVSEALAAAGDPAWTGFKFGWAGPGSVADRVAMVAAAARTLTALGA